MRSPDFPPRPKPKTESDPKVMSIDKGPEAQETAGSQREYGAANRWQAVIDSIRASGEVMATPEQKKMVKALADERVGSGGLNYQKGGEDEKALFRQISNLYKITSNVVPAERLMERLQTIVESEAAFSGELVPVSSAEPATVEEPAVEASAEESEAAEPSDVQEQVRELRNVAKELHFKLLEDMKERGLTPQQVQSLWDQAVTLDKNLSLTVDRFRRSVTSEERAQYLSHFNEAKDRLEREVIPAILNSARTTSVEAERPREEVTQSDPENIETVEEPAPPVDEVQEAVDSIPEQPVEASAFVTDELLTRQDARRIRDVANRAEGTRGKKTAAQEDMEIEGEVISQEPKATEAPEAEVHVPVEQEVQLEADEEIVPEPETLPLSSLEEPTAEQDLTPKEKKGRLGALLGKAKAKQARTVPHSFTEGEPELPESVEPEAVVIDKVEVPGRSASEMRTHAQVLALETRGPEAMQKLKEAFSPHDPNRATGNEARTTVEMAEKSAPYTEKMYVAEKAYLDALKSHHQKRGALSVMAEQFVKHKDPKEVQELREAWIASRAEYAGFLNTSAKERYVEKDGAFNKEQSVLDRYQRMVVAREVVLGAEEAEQRAKIEGLSQRERGALDKAFETYKKLPPGVRILGTAALFTGGAALAAGGGALAAVPLALGGTSAALRWYAEAKGSKVASMLSRLTSVGAIAGLAGEYGTKAVHAALGTEEKAVETIAQREVRTGSGTKTKAVNLGDAANLSALSRSREKALGATETVQRHSRVARFLSSVTGGALFGGALHEHAAGTSVPEHDTQIPAEPVAAPNPFSHEAPFRESSMGYQPMSADDLKHVYHAEDAAPQHDAAPSHEGHSTISHSGHRTHFDHSPRADSAPAAETTPTVHLTDEDRNLIQEWEIKNGGLPSHSDEHIPEVLARLREDNGPDTFKDVHFEAGHTVETSAPEAPVPDTTQPTPEPEVAHESAAEPAPEPVPVAPEPAPETAPEPVAPVHHETSATHEAPKHQPEHITSAPVDTVPSDSHATGTDTYESHDSAPMNTHGLLIDRQTPHIYADEKNNLIVHGGTPKQQIEMVNDFFKKPENFGKTLFTTSSTPDPLTGQPDVVPYISQPDGKFGPHLILRDDAGNPYLPPTENDFIKKVL